MDALRQIFQDYCPARGAALTCPARFNRSHNSTSIFCFVGRILNQLIPRRILNALTQTMIPDHAFDVQRFKGDESEHGNESVTKLMSKVAATIGDPFVDAPRRFALLFSLRFRKCFLVRAKEARVSYLLACRKCGEVRKPNVYADGSIILWQRFERAFHREAREPLARCGACNSERLNLARQRAMQFDPHVSNFRQAQLTMFHREAGLCISERVVSFTRVKARKACFLFSFFNTTKEVLKSLIKPSQHILQYLTVNLIKFGTGFFDFWKLVSLFNVADRLTLKPVCVSPLLKSGVIEFAAKRKGTIQASGLRLAWIDAIFERLGYYLFSHA